MLKILLYIFAIYVAFVLILYLLQRVFIYLPSQIAPTPEEAGVPEMSVVELSTEDGLLLKAWYRKPAGNYPTIIYFHGNAGHIGIRAPIVKPFLDQGFGVLLLTYRGYSGNPGRPSEKGLMQDARAAINFLGKESCIVLYGNSIGSSVAIQMATEFPVKAVVLQSPFPTLGDVGQYHYPFLPVKWLIWDRYDSNKTLSQIKVPVLVIRGSDDWIIHPKFGLQVYEKLPGPKQIETIEGKGHNDLFEPDLVIGFIEKNVKCY